MIDWHEIKKDYFLGLKSNVVIAREHGISEGAIRKRAKRDAWVKGKPVQQTDTVINSIDLVAMLLGKFEAELEAIDDMKQLVREHTAQDYDGRRRRKMLDVLDVAYRVNLLIANLEVLKLPIENLESSNN